VTSRSPEVCVATIVWTQAGEFAPEAEHGGLVGSCGSNWSDVYAM
jgi:hypothetical protein